MNLKLKKSSWENIFENIRRDAPDKPTGNFWSAIQNLEDQLTEKVRLNPKKYDD